MADQEPQETIVAAALRIAVPFEFVLERWNGERVFPTYLIVSAPPPARHYTLIHPLGDLTGKVAGPSDQGFLTSSGAFVGRHEAMLITIKANQPHVKGAKLVAGQPLYSEDLW